MHKRMIEIQNIISEFDETDERFGQRGGHRNRTHSDAGGSGFGVAGLIARGAGTGPTCSPSKIPLSHLFLKNFYSRAPNNVV